MNKKHINLLIFLCTCVYFVSYITRINYAAVILEIVRTKGISNAQASIALTGSAISYGFGQLISGYMGDRLKPQHMMTAGLLCASVMNLLIPLSASPALTAVIWTVNGFAQAMLWPPIVKIMTSSMDNDTYKKACVYVSCGSSVATIFIYLISPLLIHKSGWESVFIMSASCGIIMAIIWTVFYKKLSTSLTAVSSAEKQTNKTAPASPFGGEILLILAVTMLAIILQGCLRDGVTTWMPTYISDSFNLGSEISILTSVILPIFSVASFHLASVLNRKLIKNELLCAGTIFFAGTVGSAFLTFFGSDNLACDVAASALLVGAMHGVNYILICLMPVYFIKYGKVSFVSGLINSCTYVGSAISTYSVAVIADSFGWQFTCGVWTAIALAGAVICFAFTNKWKKIKKTHIA